MGNLLETQNISSQIEEGVSLKRINFSLLKNQISAIVCPSDLEKSRLVEVLSGLSSDFTGEIYINGVNAKKNNVRRSVGLMSLTHDLDEDFTVEENFYLYADYFGLSRVQAEEAINSLVRSFNLDSKVEHSPSDLSPLDKIKALTVRALIPKPEVLIIDEPALVSCSSPEFNFFKLLRDYRKDTSVVYITSKVPRHEDYLDVVSFVLQGKVVCSDSPEELMSERVGKQVAIYKFKKHDLQYFINKIENKYSYQVINNKIRLYFNETTDIIESAGLLPGEDFQIRKPCLEDILVKISGHEYGGNL